MSESEIKSMVKIVEHQCLDPDLELPVLKVFAEHSEHEELWTAAYCYLHGVIMGKRLERARRARV